MPYISRVGRTIGTAEKAKAGKPMTEYHVLYRCTKCKRVERRTYVRESSHVLNNRGAVIRTNHVYTTLDGVRMWYETEPVDCCGGQMKSAKVVGRESDHVCDARCTNATGPNCECSCKGKNHGKSYAA